MKSIHFGRFPEMTYGCTEAINTLATNLSFAGENVRRIVFTSCRPGDGKSFISFHAALTLAKNGKSTILVDTDLRKSMLESRMHIKYDDPESKSGLSHYLAGMASLEEIVYETNVENLSLIPIGRKVNNSLSLLNSPKFQDLIEILAEHWDYVIVDAPPLGALIDAAQVARSCDGAVLVVSWNTIHRQELIQVKQQLEQTGCTILGTVLNQVEFGDYLERKYYSYKSYKYDYSYSASSESRKR